MLPYLANRDDAPVSVWRDAAVGLTWFTVGALLMWGLPELRIGGWGPPGSEPVAWSVLVLAVACAAESLRRVSAATGLLVAVCALVVGAVWLSRIEFGTLLVLADLLYCSVLYTAPRTARIVAAACGAVVVALALVVLVTAGGRTAVLSVLNLALVVGVPLVWGAEVRRHPRPAVSPRRDSG